MAEGNMNFVQDMEEEAKRITSLEQMAGKGLMMPFNPSNSGPRKIMQSTFVEHLLSLENPEPPLIGTGYEFRFGEHSSSYNIAEDDFAILHRIEKFSFAHGNHYFLIIQNHRTGEYDVIERKSYKYIGESYTYSYNNSYLDKKSVGDVIQKGDVYQKSTAFDENNNRQDGVNLLTGYISCELNKEDGVIISETASKKLAAPTMKMVNIIINDNDIPINLYGDDSCYKCMPNVGEYIQNGVLLALRRNKKDEALFSQSRERLRGTFISDDQFLAQGQVVDIDIYCNNPELLATYEYNDQLRYYYDDDMRFRREFNSKVRPYILQRKCSYRLQKIYYNNEKILNGGQFIRDAKPPSFVSLTLYVKDVIDAKQGDKIANRYGGKGVISVVLPDEMMPMLSNGERLECIQNPEGCPNRENPGQLFEQTINQVGSRIIDYIGEAILHQDECLELYLEYLKEVSPQQYIEIVKYLSESDLTEDDKQYLLNSVLDDNGIAVSLRPITDNMSLDKLASLIHKFPFAKPYTITVPQRDSNGNIRYIEARRPITCGRIYMYRMKQYAEEKFSAVSLSATNNKNENSRTSKKNFKSIYAKTPIKFGEMESGDLSHMGVENVITGLMLYSASPWGRRLTEELITGDPFDVDVKLDDRSRNRSVEILNAYLTTIGLKLDFEKVPKTKKKIWKRKILTFHKSPENIGKKKKVWHKLNAWEKPDMNLVKGDGKLHIWKKSVFKHKR